MNTENELGKIIKKLRKLKGYTQQQTAELADIDDKHLSKIENGIHKPTYQTLIKLSKVLNFDLSDMSTDDPVLMPSFLFNNTAYQKSLKILQSSESEAEVEHYYEILKLVHKIIHKINK